jgi:hypothetical protein
MSYLFGESTMKPLFAILLTLAIGSPVLGQVVITPNAPPAVHAGATLRFTANQAVRWSMAPGSQGTIDANTGVYTAPSSVAAQQSYGGCQLLPNNHIFNTRIDLLPLHPNSAAWIDKANAGSIFYSADFPVNYPTESLQAARLVFNYGPIDNEPFLIPSYPDARVQSGYFASDNFDRHIFLIGPRSCVFQELYNLYAAGHNPRCPQCTAASGLKYLSSTYDLPGDRATNAAGTPIMPLVLRLQEVQHALATGGTINHALAVTLRNSDLARSFVWPATAHAYAPWGIIPYGARFRLQSRYSIAHFSPTAQLLLTQLKQYGLIATDGGSAWEVGVEYTKWPTSIQAAFAEIKAAIKPTDLEAVDESGLMISPNSGNTNVGGETVIATSIAKSNQRAQMPVVLTGITLNLPRDQEYIQVGTPTRAFTAYVGGTENTEVLWSASPMVGTLTTDGQYSPPESLDSPQTMTVTATSGTDKSVSAQMTVTIFPAGAIRILLGSMKPYVDPGGNTWQASTGYDVGAIPTNGWVGPTPPSIHLYREELFAPGDLRFDLAVPNGTYQVTGKFASTNATKPGQFVFHIESQGQIVKRDLDVFAAAGGAYKPIDFTVQAPVKENQLSYVLRHVLGENVSIAAIEIQPLSLDVAKPGSNPPAPPSGITAVVKP